MKKELESFEVKKITRVEVIDENGRGYIRWGCKIQIRIQDDGRTLKIFLEKGKKEKPDMKDWDNPRVGTSRLA